MKVVIQDLCKSFGSKQVLRNITGEFEKGKIYGLLGKNGAGKTTLFNCMSSEIDYDSGEVYLLKDGKREELNYKNMGFVYSTAILPEFLTGYEFVKFYMGINIGNDRVDKTIDEYFELVHMDEADRYRLINDYSLGMKNKIQLLMVLITKPDVIFLDEPLTSLDMVVAHDIKNLLLELKNDRIIILSTHIMQVAVDLCDEIVILNNGTLTRFGEISMEDYASLENRIMEELE